jgi:hypothetical protein
VAAETALVLFGSNYYFFVETPVKVSFLEPVAVGTLLME